MASSLPAVSELLNIARRAAADGAQVIRRPLSRDRVATKGVTGDVVTELDVLAERRIRKILIGARPEDRVVGEELTDAGAPNAELRWSVDPLDGTTNKVKGLPHYASSVAVQSTSTGAWLAGAVHAPELGKEYFAARGEGAWVKSSRGIERLTGPDDGAAPRLLGTGFSYDSSARTTQFADLSAHMRHFDDMRSLGSAALGLCAVADGSVDAFVESDLYEFDWAAAALIAEEAGATVTRPEQHRGGIVAYFGTDFR